MVAEVALASMLIVGTGLLLRSFITLLDVDLGFQPRGAAAWRIERLPAVSKSRAERVAYHQQLVKAMKPMPRRDRFRVNPSLQSSR